MVLSMDDSTSQTDIKCTFVYILLSTHTHVRVSTCSFTRENAYILMTVRISTYLVFFESKMFLPEAVMHEEHA